jgi:TonB family protein
MRAFLILLALLPSVVLAEWVTDKVTGCAVFVEYAGPTDNVSWTGPCENGRAHGVGVFTSTNGTRIEGEFREGRAYNARGKEPLLVLPDGRLPMIDVTYMAGTGTRLGTQLKQQSPAERASYAARIASAVRRNLVHADPIDGNPACVVDVRVDPQGKILSAALVKSSGVSSWDEAVMRALERTGTLPLDVDQKIPPRIELAFRPH